MHGRECCIASPLLSEVVLALADTSRLPFLMCRCCFHSRTLLLSSTGPCQSGSVHYGLGGNKPTIIFLASSGNLVSETECSALQVAMGLCFSPIISILLSDKNVRECQSKTKSKNWEKCGQSALMPTEALIFTQDFSNFCFFMYVSSDCWPKFWIQYSNCKRNSIVPKTTSFSVLLLYNSEDLLGQAYSSPMVSNYVI